MSSSNSPCAACKCLRRKCTQECVFAPYFPPDDPQKFINVHRVFGSSNVTKILSELNVGQREEAAKSLAYEADCRLKDPVYGCVGLISILQHRLKQVHLDIESAKKELATFIGPSAMLPILNHSGFVHHDSPYQVMPYNNVHPMTTGLPHGAHLMIGEPLQQQQQQQQQQFLEAHQIRSYNNNYNNNNNNYELQQQQSDLLKFNGGFDDATGFNQIAGGGMQQQPSLSLGCSYEAIPYHQIQQQEQSHLHPHHHHHLLQFQQQQELLLQQQQQQNVTNNHPLRAKSEEGERSIGPSC